MHGAFSKNPELNKIWREHGYPPSIWVCLSVCLDSAVCSLQTLAGDLALKETARGTWVNPRAQALVWPWKDSRASQLMVFGGVEKRRQPITPVPYCFRFGALGQSLVLVGILINI